MDFKKFFSNTILTTSLLVIFVMGVISWKFLPKSNSSPLENVEILPLTPEGESNVPVKRVIKNLPVQVALDRESTLDISQKDDASIQEQFDRDRDDQRQTKYLKTKLEQTNLELEQEKALAEINKLKMENTGIFNDPASEGQKNLPEVKVEYIGGDSVKKEAILSIAGARFQVKEKSSLTDNIQVVSISDSSVTLHFSSPVALTKTIDYKPE
jgi:hypothetical protein